MRVVYFLKLKELSFRMSWVLTSFPLGWNVSIWTCYPMECHSNISQSIKRDKQGRRGRMLPIPDLGQEIPTLLLLSWEQKPHYAAYMAEMLVLPKCVPSKGRVGHIGRQSLSALTVLAQCSSHLQGIWWVPSISCCSVWGVATTVKSSSPSAWSGTRVSHPWSEEETGKKQATAEPQRGTQSSFF